jgi:hypothetical protein
MNLSTLIKELQQGLEEHGDLEVMCFHAPDDARDISEVFVSGDGEVCISTSPLRIKQIHVERK